MPVKVSEFGFLQWGGVCVKAPVRKKVEKKGRFFTELTVFSTTLVKRGNKKVHVSLFAFHFWEEHVVFLIFFLLLRLHTSNFWCD